MNDIQQAIESALAWGAVPATLFGAGGALVRSLRKGQTWKQTLLEGVAGILVANMAGPLISLHAPSHWHYTLYFLVGWGGLEGVGRLYEAAVSGLERRIQTRIGAGPDNPDSPDSPEFEPSTWDGVDRRKRR